MKTETFKQRRFTSRYSYELDEVSVRVNVRQLLGSKSYRVPLENITDEPVEVTVSSSTRFWITVVLVILALFTGTLAIFDADVEADAWLFYGSFAAAAGFSYWLSRATFLVYRAGEPALSMLKNYPSEEAVRAFVEEVQNQKYIYLLTRYLSAEPSPSPAEELKKIVYLKERGVISEEEFDSLKQEIIGNTGGDSGNFGFQL